MILYPRNSAYVHIFKICVPLSQVLFIECQINFKLCHIGKKWIAFWGTSAVSEYMNQESIFVNYPSTH